MTATILNFGSINIDHIYQVPHFVRPGETLASSNLDTVLGGKGANQSVAIARAGGRVKHLGRACKNDQWVFTYLEACGVDISHVERPDESSGHAIIQVDSRGENAIVLHGGANQTFDYASLERAISSCQKGDYFLAQNECNLLNEAIAMALDSELKVVLNPAPMTDYIRQLPLEDLDTLIVNQVEAQDLCGEHDMDGIILALKKQLPSTRVVITLGGEGAVLISQGSIFKAPAASAKVVDTTAAGDTFVGYFLASLTDGLSEVAALNRACIAAAITVESLGAIPSIPTLEQVNSRNSVL